MYLIQGLNYLLPLLVLPYLLKVLSPESFGVFAYSQAFVQFLILIVDFGFNLTITKKISSLSEDSPEVVNIYWLISFIKFCFFVGLSLLVLLIFYFVPSMEIYRTAVLWSLITLAGTVLFPVWLYQGLNKMKMMSIINAGSKLLTFPFIFILVKEKSDYLPAVIIHSGSYLLAGIIAGTLIWNQKRYRIIPVKDLNFRNAMAQIRYSWPIFLSNSAISLYTSSLTLMLGFYGTATQVGLLGAIERIIRVLCFGVYLPINQAAFPTLARLAAIDFLSARRLFRIIFYSILGGMSMVYLVFILMDSYVIHYFLNEYANIEKLLRISIFTILPIALGAVCGQLGLVALGDNNHKNIFSKIYLIVGLVSLPISFLSIRYFLVEGAVFSMMLTEGVIFVAMFAFVKKYRFL